MQDHEHGLNSADAATQALRDGVSRARQMVHDAKRTLKRQQEFDGELEALELAPDRA